MSGFGHALLPRRVNTTGLAFFTCRPPVPFVCAVCGSRCMGQRNQRVCTAAQNWRCGPEWQRRRNAKARERRKRAKERT